MAIVLVYLDSHVDGYVRQDDEYRSFLGPRGLADDQFFRALGRAIHIPGGCCFGDSEVVPRTDVVVAKT